MRVQTQMRLSMSGSEARPVFTAQGRDDGGFDGQGNRI
jgi:hypothetical protein